MICRLVCAVFCVLATLAGTARAKSPVDPFADQGHITAWIAAYRDQPQPHLVPRMVQALAAQGLLHEQDRAGIYIGFVAGVLAENQVEARKLVTRMFPLPPPAQALIIKSIAYSGLPEWKELLKSFVERMPARQVLIRKYLYGKARTLEELPFDEGPKVLDTWWGYYYATGNYQPVLRIMTVLPWSSDRESVERLTVGSMAKWTLAQNASSDKPLLDFCRAELHRQPEGVAAPLREIVAAAETFETGKIRKQAVKAIEELKAKGPESRRKWAWWGQAGQMALSVGCVAAAATGQTYLGLPCVIGGAASSAALKLWGGQGQAR